MDLGNLEQYQKKEPTKGDAQTLFEHRAGIFAERIAKEFADGTGGWFEDIAVEVERIAFVEKDDPTGDRHHFPHATITFRIPPRSDDIEQEYPPSFLLTAFLHHLADSDRLVNFREIDPENREYQIELTVFKKIDDFLEVDALIPAIILEEGGVESSGLNLWPSGRHEDLAPFTEVILRGQGHNVVAWAPVMDGSNTYDIAFSPVGGSMLPPGAQAQLPAGDTVPPDNALDGFRRSKVFIFGSSKPESPKGERTPLSREEILEIFGVDPDQIARGSFGDLPPEIGPGTPGDSR